MNKSIKNTGLAVLIIAAALSGCDKKDESGATTTEAEAPKTVETVETHVSKGGVSAAMVVEKSTEASDTVFEATTQIQKLTAKVAAFNLETRDFTLVTENGVEFELTAQEDAQNLDQIAVGDTVHAEHMQQVTIELVQDTTLIPSETNIEIDKQAGEGEMPARASAEKNISIYTVEEINLEDNTFVLKNVTGDIQRMTAKNPQNLERASVGDAVVVTFTGCDLNLM